MPEEALWPPWTETWSLHTVIQGGQYFDALLKAMNRRYGEPKGIEEFCLKGQVMNYESARGMFEAYGRNKYWATGITAWKYDAAWPASPTWQFVDWYLLAGGAYYGAKKACESLHVQYSYDDHSIVVVNERSQGYEGLTVTARVFNLDMGEKYARTATVSVGPDGVTRAFVIEWPEGLSRTHFLLLTLTDSEGQKVSENFYWLSTVPDIPGRKGYTPERIFWIEPASTADFTDLALLPPVEVRARSVFEGDGETRRARVTVSNPSNSLAFFIHLAIRKGPGGAEVAPTYWEDNYFSLLPGEERTVSAEFAAEDLEGAAPVVAVDGWNVRAQELR